MDSPNELAGRLLVIHDEPAVRCRVVSAAEGFGFAASEAAAMGEAARLATHGAAFAGVLVSADMLRQHLDSIAETLCSLREAAGTNHVIALFDAAPDLELSRQSIEAGIIGFVRAQAHQVDQAGLRRHLNSVAQRNEEQQRRREAHRQTLPLDQSGFIARSPVMTQVVSKAARAARVSDVPVIIYGESGTGKQLLAETIHRLDPKRSGRRFLSVNCASISGTLADSELFGHVKGAFTGATEDRQGHFRAADGGTLLLDEIGELDLALQPKLLRVLQEGLVLPVGADEEVEVDVRVIAATHRRLPAMVEQETFRLDLYQRLNVVALEIPPLRERPEDLQALLKFFVKKYAGYYHGSLRGTDPDLCAALARLPLNGNVRELENTIRQMLALKTRGDMLDLADLETIGYGETQPGKDTGHVVKELVEIGSRLLEHGQLSLPSLMEQLERDLLSEVMRNSTETTVDLARRLGVSRRTFYNKIRKHRL